MKADISINNDVYRLVFDKNPSTTIVFQIKHYNFRELEEYQYKNFSGLKNNIKIEKVINYLDNEKLEINVLGLKMNVWV